MAIELGWNLSRLTRNGKTILKISIYSKEVPPNKAFNRNAISYETKFRKHLKKAGEYDAVEIYINSGGGAIDSAYGMVQALYSIKKGTPGRILIDNYCGSAATLVLCGLKCPAYIVPGGRIMTHMPRVHEFKKAGGVWSIYEKFAGMLAVNNIIAFYRSRTKRKYSRKEIRAWMERSRRFTPDEAVEAGMVDGIMTRAEFERRGT